MKSSFLEGFFFLLQTLPLDLAVLYNVLYIIIGTERLLE
ncbi:Hypothetical protein ACI5QM_00575 [Bacillus subtilis]